MFSSLGQIVDEGFDCMLHNLMALKTKIIPLSQIFYLNTLSLFIS
jgi:hypothetical protein